MYSRSLACVGALCGVLASVPPPSSAASLTPLYSNSAGAVRQFTATYCTDAGSLNVVLTSVINSSGNLEIITWWDTDTSLERLSSVTAGQASLVSAACFYHIPDYDVPYLVTALANSSGNLEIICWFISNSGALIRQSSYTSAATATEISMVAGFSQNVVFTASRDTSGNLDVNAFCIDSSGGVTPCGTAGGGAVSQVATAFTYNQFASAVRDANGKLEVTAWTWSSNQLIRGGTITAGAIKQVAAGNAQGGQSQIYTAVVNGSGNLEMIAWNIDSSAQLSRLGSYTAGAATQVALCDACFDDAPYEFTVVRNGAGNLSAELWTLIPPPVQELASYNTIDPVSPVAATVSYPYEYHLLTGARDTSGNLQLQVWLAQ